MEPKIRTETIGSKIPNWRDDLSDHLRIQMFEKPPRGEDPRKVIQEEAELRLGDNEESHQEKIEAAWKNVAEKLNSLSGLKEISEPFVFPLFPRIKPEGVMYPFRIIVVIISEGD
jgi:hypothetical protein